MMTQNWPMPQPPRLVAVNVDAADAAKNYAADVVVEGDAAQTVGGAGRARCAGGDASRPPLGRPPFGGRASACGADDPPASPALRHRCERRARPETVVVRRHVHPRLLAGWRCTRSRAAAAGLSRRLGHARLRLPGVDRRRAGAGRPGALRVRRRRLPVRRAASWPPSPRSSAPLTVLLVDDGGYGMLRYDQSERGRAAVRRRPGTPDFAALAASFGDRRPSGRRSSWARGRCARRASRASRR